MRVFRQLFLSLFFPLLALILIDHLTLHRVAILRSLLAASPILIVLVSMLFFRLGGHIAGPIGVISGLLVAYFSYGVTKDVFWISQAKGILLSLFVIAIFYPALLLYNTINLAGGIQALVGALQNLISDRPTLLITTAWAFSGLMEGVAGFGLPVAIISPMLVGMGVSPLLAVSAVAVGHAWSVTFGDMGVVFQTLTSVVRVNPHELQFYAVFLLGIACLLCGFAAAYLLKSLCRWPVIIVLAVIMSSTQYWIVSMQIPALAGILAGASGLLGAMVLGGYLSRKNGSATQFPVMTKPLVSALRSYGLLTAILVIVSVWPPIRQALGSVAWSVSFPEATTYLGFVTAAVPDQIYQPLLHPGSFILLITIFSYLVNRRDKLYSHNVMSDIASITWRTSSPAILGVVSMVGLSSLMDHTGMTIELAQMLSRLFHMLYPLISPIIGMIGAFATGSNNNSNVLFGPLQEGVALLLEFSPAVIVAAQTTGGSLGSMIAPAKIIVGCSTVGLQGHDGDVLRKTVPIGAAIGLFLGVVTMFLAR
jgi:lactate permease